MKTPVKQITTFERLISLSKSLGEDPEDILMMCCTKPSSEFVNHVGKIIEGLTYTEKTMATICIVLNVPDEGDFSVAQEFKSMLILTIESITSANISLQGNDVVCISMLNLRSRRTVRYERSTRDRGSNRGDRGAGYERRNREQSRAAYHDGHLLRVTKPLNGFDLSLSIPIPDNGLVDIFNLIDTLNSLRAHVPHDRDGDVEPFLLTVERLNPEKPDEEISIDVH